MVGRLGHVNDTGGSQFHRLTVIVYRVELSHGIGDAVKLVQWIRRGHSNKTCRDYCGRRGRLLSHFLWGGGDRGELTGSWDGAGSGAVAGAAGAAWARDMKAARERMIDLKYIMEGFVE